MDIKTFLELSGIGTEEDIKYLPTPNTGDVVLTEHIAPLDIIPTSFCFAFLDDGRVVLANNRRRGGEITGGHRDMVDGVLETPETTAIRETFEEGGVKVKNITPIGFMRSIIAGQRPDNYKYPFPVSAQQFFVGQCEAPADYVENDECKAPLLVDRKDIGNFLSGRGLVLYEEAYRVFTKTNHLLT